MPFLFILTGFSRKKEINNTVPAELVKDGATVVIKEKLEKMARQQNQIIFARGEKRR